MPPVDRGLVAWALAHPALDPTAAARPVLTAGGARAAAYRVTKRALDVMLGAVLILLTLPIMIATAVAVKCTSPGPVLFAQRRAGRFGRPFTMYKFRSMVQGADEDRMMLEVYNELPDGPCFKLRNDPRLTPIGRFLRQTSIDELPQLFSVLKGEMTLVGPRPLPLHEVSRATPVEQRRLDVTPGLTCLWQISGRSEIPYDEWMQLDVYYVEHASLMLDIEILIKTLPAVLSRRGAY